MSIGNICRACLVQMDTFRYYLMDNVPSEIYTFCTTIEIKSDENLPRALCNICYDLLTKFFNFKQKCIQSQNNLSNYNLMKPEAEPDYVMVIDSIKSEANCHNTDTTKEIPNKLEFFNNTDNTKLVADNKHSSEPDNSHCSDDIFSTTQRVPKDVLVKQEHFKISIDFNDMIGYDGKSLKHKQIVTSIKSNNNSFQRKIKSETVKTPAKLKSVKPYFICDLCHRIFYSPNTYRFHKLTHSSKEFSIKCTACTKTFMTLSGLRRHLRSCHTKVDLKFLKCEICGRISKSKEALKMHLKIHGERKLHVCDTCGKSTTTTHSFKAHLETHKHNREKTFTCEHCGKKFFTNNILVAHVSRRHSSRRFVCDLCAYPFTAKSNLVKHLLLHEGKKAHKCNICSKAFAAKSTLVEHERIHSGERPFSCNYCPKNFASRRRLADHHRIHTGEKPYKCQLCDQAFTQCGTLNRHMRVHEKNVPLG